MDSREPYDWVDDEDIDMGEVMRRVESLESAPVRTPLTLVNTSPTAAGNSDTVTKSVFGGDRRPGRLSLA
ncbi:MULTISPECIES: hypothetical protein [Micromonospora]|uniref:hypothetical protein n=1 Tax=Micromonospora TaxID=1873 RepID=UPI0033EEC922